MGSSGSFARAREEVRCVNIEDLGILQTMPAMSVRVLKLRRARSPHDGDALISSTSIPSEAKTVQPDPSVSLISSRASMWIWRVENQARRRSREGEGSDSGTREGMR